MSEFWATKGSREARKGVLENIHATVKATYRHSIDDDLKNSYVALAYTFINKDRKDMLFSKYSSSSDKYVHKKYMYKLLKYFHNQIRDSVKLSKPYENELEVIEENGAELIKNCKYLLALDVCDYHYLNMHYGVKE